MSLILIGAGGHAKVVMDAALAAGQHIAQIQDDDPEKFGLPFLNATINPRTEEIFSECQYVIAIGNNAVRRSRYELLLSKGVVFGKVLHPRAVISPFAKIGAGAVVFSNAVVNPDAVIGNNVIINTGAIIEHDCLLENHVQVCPNATLAGTVHVGENAFIATGATIIPNIKIGKNSYVAAGAVVTRDVPDNVLVAGCPARIVKYFKI